MRKLQILTPPPLIGETATLVSEVGCSELRQEIQWLEAEITSRSRRSSPAVVAAEEIHTPTLSLGERGRQSVRQREVKLPRFSGSSSWEPYRAQMTLIAQHSGWKKAETTMRLGRRESTELHRSRLTSRRRQSGESWGAVAADLRLHAHLGHPNLGYLGQDELALQVFLQALAPEKLRHYVALTAPGSLDEALKEAERAAAIMGEADAAERGRPRPPVRVAECSEETEEVRWKRTLPNSQRRCYRCDERGHIARYCPAPTPTHPEPEPAEPNLSKQPSAFLKADRWKFPSSAFVRAGAKKFHSSVFVKADEQPFHSPAFLKAGVQESHFPAFLKADESNFPQIGRLGSGNGLYLQCWLDGQPCRALIDTGATISLVRPGVLHDAHWKPTDTRLQSVTGQRMGMMGWKKVGVAVGYRCVDHQFWLTEIRNYCIVGLDLLARWGATINIARPALIIGTDAYELQSTAGEQIARRAHPPAMATAQPTNSPPQPANPSGRTNPICPAPSPPSCSPSADTTKAVHELWQCSCSGLDPAQSQQLKRLLTSNLNLFAVSDEECTQTNLVQHHIDTSDAAPIRLRPHHLSLSKQRAAEEKLAMSAPADPAAAATTFPSPAISLPVGLDILRTYSGALVCLEIIFGGLVWILVASSNIPVPLLQGWVMLVSVSMFAFSLTYLIVFLLGLADRINTDWNFLDLVYHFIALLFYFGAFVLEAAATAANGRSFTYANLTQVCVTISSGNIVTFMDSRQYSINVAATIFAFVVMLCYGCSMFMGFKRWRTYR
ncbi:hypothetical protein GJAV_G00020760 [Gymnothorax javanicus]|nr:hypothetical protein GJAV_G00020760 [Gymnothorax javanicus]